jgi:hypothetical protein
MKNMLKHLIAAAQRAPSGDNCQPFKFKIENETTMSIWHSDQMAMHFFNVCNSASYISLGMVLETIIIEATGFNFETHYDFINSTEKDQEFACWARVHFTKKSDVKFDPLVGTYYGRWTSRMKYENAQLPKEMYDELVLQCKIASTDISIYHAKPTDKDFISYLKTSELYLWKYSQAARDFLKMVRISDSNKSETRNGIKLAELHLNLFEAFLLKMMMRCPLLIPFFYHAGLKKVTQLLAQKNYFNSAGLVIFCTPRSEIFETSLINTGRTSMRAWLYLNANGYAVQPNTLASLMPFQFENNKIPTSVDITDRNFLGTAADLMKTYFKISNNEHLVWALRIGKSKDKNNYVRSSRFKLEDVIKK